MSRRPARWKTDWRCTRRRGRIALVATVGASGMAALDATVVNVALPHIGEDFDASISQLQWVLTGYLLALASLILLGGALGDRFGRRRVFLIGTIWFAAASLLCGASPNIEVLVAARVLQGVGAALLTPGQPRDPPGELPPSRSRARGRRVVGPRRCRGRDRSVPRRLARRRPGLAVGVPHQRADRVGRRRVCARRGARDPRPARGARPRPRRRGPRRWSRSAPAPRRSRRRARTAGPTPA